MADSDFWHELAAQFLSLHSGGPDPLWAQWQHELGTPVADDMWRPSGPASLLAQFEPLARRGAMKIDRKGIPDLLHAWLEALASESVNFGVHSHPIKEPGGPSWMIGRIVRLCEASANYCKKLESAALQAEYEERQRSERPEPQPAPQPEPAAPKPESIGEQIRRLREECHLSEEELAEEVELDTRTVQRHEADDMKPQPRRIRAYEEIFSKLLNRKVVIQKTP